MPDHDVEIAESPKPLPWPRAQLAHLHRKVELAITTELKDNGVDMQDARILELLRALVSTVKRSTTWMLKDKDGYPAMPTSVELIAYAPEAKHNGHSFACYWNGDMITRFAPLFPDEWTNHDFHDWLVQQVIVDPSDTKEQWDDPESSCYYISFRDTKTAERFFERLTRALQRRMVQMKALHKPKG